MRLGVAQIAGVETRIGNKADTIWELPGHGFASTNQVFGRESVCVYATGAAAPVAISQVGAQC